MTKPATSNRDRRIHSGRAGGADERTNRGWSVNGEGVDVKRISDEDVSSCIIRRPEIVLGVVQHKRDNPCCGSLDKSFAGIGDENPTKGIT